MACTTATSKTNTVCNSPNKSGKTKLTEGWDLNNAITISDVQETFDVKEIIEGDEWSK